MPAAAVASFTPAISGIAGTSVGARGETAVDIRGFRLEEGSALYHLHARGGRGRGADHKYRCRPCERRDPFPQALVVEGSRLMVCREGPWRMGPGSALAFARLA